MTKESDNIREQVFRITQTFLKTPPLIVWGSGATVPFGLPSMFKLNEKLKEEIIGFDTTNTNLELELGKEKYKNQIPEIKNVIWNEINGADIAVLEKITSNEIDSFKGIKLLIDKFIDVHPKVLNIVTTNYDRVLEYVMAYHSINFTDGFTGKTLSCFDENLFQNKDMVNLIKVHGSLNWFDVSGELRFMNNCYAQHSPKIIAPGRNKFQEAYNSPYRELIQKADTIIKNASSFLIIGFGFNDEHLTPRIITQIKKGAPVVLITKSITDSTYKEIEKAEKYILFEEKEVGVTRIMYKNNNINKKMDVTLNGNFWQLNNFIEIL